MKNYFFLFLMMPVVNIKVIGQEPKIWGLGAFEYSLVSGIGDTDLRTYQIGLNTFVNNKSNSFGFGVGYNSHQFLYLGQSVGFDESAFEKFHTLRLEFVYSRQLGRNWSIKFSMAPVLSSNFAEEINNEDFIPNANIVLSKLWQSEHGISELTLGAGYGTLFGSPQWYPTLSFSRKTDSSWSYVLGVPETQIMYTFNERHNLKARAGLFGVYANNSRTMIYQGVGELTHTKLRYSGSNIGLEHNYDMGTGFTTMVRAGFQQTDNFEVLNTKDVMIHDFEPDGTIYVTMGLKYKLN